MTDLGYRDLHRHRPGTTGRNWCRPRSVSGAVGRRRVIGAYRARRCPRQQPLRSAHGQPTGTGQTPSSPRQELRAEFANALVGDSAAPGARQGSLDHQSGMNARGTTDCPFDEAIRQGMRRYPNDPDDPFVSASISPLLTRAHSESCSVGSIPRNGLISEIPASGSPRRCPPAPQR